MSRWHDIEMSLNSARKDVLAIEEHLNTLNEHHSHEAVYRSIKSAVQELRSALDYSTHDIAEALGLHSKVLYFPYVHPNNPQGNLRTAAEITTEFQRAVHRHLRGLETALPDVYNVLERVQGELWLSQLIESANSVKHDRLPKLGTRAMRIGEGITIIGEGIVMHPGSTFNGERISKRTKIGPTSRINREFCKRHQISFTETLDVDTVRPAWLDPIQVWIENTAKLMNEVYDALQV